MNIGTRVDVPGPDGGHAAIVLHYAAEVNSVFVVFVDDYTAAPGPLQGGWYDLAWVTEA